MKTTFLTKLICCACFALLACGCGSQEYEKRLQNTVEYYEYLEVQNKNLASAWFQGNAISYRVPLQFEMIPAPNPTDYDADGNLQPGISDLRQPTFIHGMKLDGLQAAWRVEIPLGQRRGNSEEKNVSIPGYLYIVSNRDYFLNDEQTEIAPEFTETTLANISGTLHTSASEEENWNEVRIPEKPVYTKQKRFDMLTLSSNDAVLGLRLPTGVRIYRYDAGSIQTLLIFILPRDIENGKKDDGNNLLKRIDMSLETLMVSDQMPTRVVPGAGGGVPTGGF